MIIDIILLLLLFLGIYKGYKKGLIKALFFLLGVLIGFIAGLKFCMVFAQYASNNGFSHSKWLPTLMFFLIFILCIVASSFVAKIFEKSGEMLMLGWINRIFGILLYCLFYVATFSIILSFGTQTIRVPSWITSSSFFYNYLIKLAPMFMDSLGKVLPFIKGASSQLKTYFDTASGNFN
jgi:membrane protein required for colicin V production